MKLKDTVHYDWYKKVFLLLFLALAVWMASSVTGANVLDVLQNTDQMTAFFRRFLRPDFSYIPQLLAPLLSTLQMSLTGTVLGVAVALPVSFLATTVVTDNRIVTGIFRFFLSIVRTIPTLLLAALLVAIFGIGEATGVLTIAIFTFGMVSQLLYEAIENSDAEPIEAMTAVGANRIKVIFWAIVPQILVYIASYSLYAFEVNVRASIVLGYVGAGGVGVLLNSALSLMRYDRVSIIVLTILVVILVIDKVSEHVRERLIG